MNIIAADDERIALQLLISSIHEGSPGVTGVCSGILKENYDGGKNLNPFKLNERSVSMGTIAKRILSNA